MVLKHPSVALVTGANRGIGREIARQLSENGVEVVVTARKPEDAEETARFLGKSSNHYQLDVTDISSIRKLAEFMQENYENIDILVNNAAIVGRKSIEEFDYEEMKEVFETNYWGPMRMVEAMLPLLKKSGNAKIINMSSNMGTHSNLKSPGHAAYRLSKAHLNDLTIHLNGELSKYKIKCYAVSPGWVRTRMGGSEAERSPEEGADTAVWLAMGSDIESGRLYRDRKEIPW